MSIKRDRSPKTRARRLRLHPLCVDCLAAGVTKATEEIDHIVPLEWAGQLMHTHEGARLTLIDIGLIGPDDQLVHIPMELDVDANTQGMCTYHNRMKRNRESYGHVTYGLDGWPIDDAKEGDPKSLNGPKELPPPPANLKPE